METRRPVAEINAKGLKDSISSGMEGIDSGVASLESRIGGGE
jgi:hypothetical protein